MSATVLHGDCIAEMRAMADASVDSIVTDPPYEIGMMGRKWDSTGIAYNVEVWAEALRVLRPGGHMLAFSGSRTYHRMVCAIEDAGFEIRDQIMWLYGSGFNKVGYIRDRDGQIVREGWGGSLKPAHEPIVVARKPLGERTVAANVLKYGTGCINIDGCRVEPDSSSNKSSSGKEDRARGCVPEMRDLRKGNTQVEISGQQGETPDDLRPCVQVEADDRGREPSVDGRCVEGLAVGIPMAAGGHTDRRGQGVATEPGGTASFRTSIGHGSAHGTTVSIHGDGSSPERHQKRQPAGEPYSDGLGGALEGTSSDRTTIGRPDAHEPATVAGVGNENLTPLGRFPANVLHDGSPEVLDAFAAFGERKSGKPGVKRKTETSHAGWTESRAAGTQMPGHGDTGTAARFFFCAKASKRERQGSSHPTVKPLALMRYLCKLVTPPGGVILDPFAGSGTTLQAAMEEGFSAIGIEQSAEYVTDIKRRLELARKAMDKPAPVPKPKKIRVAKPKNDQTWPTLFDLMECEAA